MAKNIFAQKLQYLLKSSNTKYTTLAQAVQYDLSYISKWLSGAMLPSEKTADTVLEKTVDCIVSGDIAMLMQEYACSAAELREKLLDELKDAYESCRPKRIPDKFHATQPIAEVVQDLYERIVGARSIAAVLDILSLPHESRLILAGIRNGRFENRIHAKEYSMVINMDSNDFVYDSIFLVHMLTSLSGSGFRLYSDPVAVGKLMYSIDDSAVTALLFPGNKDCISVGELSDGRKIRQNIVPFIDQEKRMFRKSTIAEMIARREYFQTMVSTNIRWILGHATELLLPQDVFDELNADRNPERKKLYRLSQSVLNDPDTKVMIYESAISDLAVDGIVDFYNTPVKLTHDQILRCMDYYVHLTEMGAQFRLIDGGFSNDFKYITNPCMFLSDSTSYLRLENNRYRDNILILNGKDIKELFCSFFGEVWNHRSDVVASDEKAVQEKLDHYRTSARILMDHT